VESVVVESELADPAVVDSDVVETMGGCVEMDVVGGVTGHVSEVLVFVRVTSGERYPPGYTHTRAFKETDLPPVRVPLRNFPKIARVLRV
jgi:hypothetical protein